MNVKFRGATVTAGEKVGLLNIKDRFILKSEHFRPHPFWASRAVARTSSESGRETHQWFKRYLLIATVSFCDAVVRLAALSPCLLRNENLKMT